MKFRVEYGCRVRETDIEKTEEVEAPSLYQLFCDLKKHYIVLHDVEGDLNNSAEDYLNEFSEYSNEDGSFYIGFEEGEYIEGWQLI
ncbi:hypothetical protein CL634_10715 [bacterium]|nr:hypothetical protein [bacterium]